MKSAKIRFGKTGLWQRGLIVFFFAILITGLLGCEDPLNVENPNSLIEDDLSNPSAAPGLTNGALASVSRAAGEMLAIYTTSTDEGTWIGSRDAWNQLDKGNLDNPTNEFVDDAWSHIGEGRWLADKAIELMEGMDSNNELADRTNLAKANLMAGLIRVMIADMFDDYAMSDKTTPAPAIGETSMNSLYDQAISNCDAALAVAQTEGDTELEARAMALRARARHAKEIWGAVNPKGGSAPSDPYVGSSSAKSDAEAVLGMVGDDWRWQLEYSAAAEFNDYSFQVNGRLELDINSPLPNDPIDGTEDPRIRTIVDELKADHSGTDYAPFTVVSAREMHLIIAETDYAGGSADAAKTRLNTLRALDGLTAITTEDVGEMIQHERRANLFAMCRRLSDMYRFGKTSPGWLTNSVAFNTYGTFFAIPRSEIEANDLIDFK